MKYYTNWKGEKMLSAIWELIGIIIGSIVLFTLLIFILTAAIVFLSEISKSFWNFLKNIADKLNKNN